MPRIMAFLLFVLMATELHAQVYKCTAADGSTTFSDKPCNENAEVVTNLDSGTSGLGSAPGGGPPSSLTLGDGKILAFKKIISIDVQTEGGYMTGRTGMHIFYEGTDHLVEFENLVSMRVNTWDRDPCGNWSQICDPRVTIQTTERQINAHYISLRHIKILIDDKLDGKEKEMTVYFAIWNKPHIRSIRF